MKKISILIPTYNEENNIIPLSEQLISIFNEKLSYYLYEIIFIDNNSKDKTRKRLIELCSQNYNIKAIFNVKKFWAIKFSLLWFIAVNGRLLYHNVRRFSRPA